MHHYKFILNLLVKIKVLYHIFIPIIWGRKKNLGQTGVANEKNWTNAAIDYKRINKLIKLSPPQQINKFLWCSKTNPIPMQKINFSIVILTSIPINFSPLIINFAPLHNFKCNFSSGIEWNVWNEGSLND